MKATTTTRPIDTTWGPRLFTHSRMSRSKSLRYTSDIKTELFDFLSDEIREWQPAIVIVVERRGTAILRAIKEARECILGISWGHVISSRVIDQLPPAYFANKRILIFDDLKQHGSQVHTVLKALMDLAAKIDLQKDIRVAVFAMHEEASSASAYPTFGVRHSWRYRGLTTAAYRKMRLDIIEMLQACGSLMLDTEHVEIRMRLNGTFPQLLNALTRKATVIPFRSLGMRQNVTVLYADNDPAHALPVDRLPLGIRTTGIVKKCRVIERSSNEFAMIPICYPIVPTFTKGWPTAQADIDLLGASILTKSSRAKFYGTALFAALAILEWTLKSLYAAEDGLVTIYLPTSSTPSKGSRGYGLDHLHVMYPTLELTKLNSELGKIAARAEHEGRQLRRRPIPHQPPLEIPENDLRKNAWALLQVIRYELDCKEQEERLVDPNWERPHPFGLTANEIFTIGDRFGWPKVETSAMFDVLIDDGQLVTEVDTQYNCSGTQYSVRVFYPDGEMVSELIRLYTNQRGLPNGF